MPNSDRPLEKDALAESVDELVDVLTTQSALIGSVLAAIIEAPGHQCTERTVEPEIGTVVGMICQGAGSSCQSMTEFPTPGYKTRDCLLIARAVVEAMINCCYIMATGPTTAQKAIRHARQKYAREHHRDSAVLDSRIKILLKDTPSCDDIPGLAEDIEEFSHRSGQEDRRWTKASLDDRIKESGRAFGKTILSELHVARFMIYRHSSEIIHGTFFGAAFWMGWLGAETAPKSQETFDTQANYWHWIAFFGVIVAVNAFLTAFHKSYGLSHVAGNAETLMKRVKSTAFYEEILDSIRSKSKR